MAKRKFQILDGKIIVVPDEIIEEKGTEELEKIYKKSKEKYHNCICEMCGKKFLSRYNQIKCDECERFPDKYTPSELQLFLLKNHFAKYIWDSTGDGPDISYESKIAHLKGEYIQFNLATQRDRLYCWGAVFNNNPNTICVIFDFKDTWDIQNHAYIIQNFRGNITNFKKEYLKLLRTLEEKGIKYDLNPFNETLLFYGQTMKEREDEERYEIELQKEIEGYWKYREK